MPDNINGAVLYPSKDGQLVPFELELLNQPNTAAEKIVIKDGEGAHPLVRVQMDAFVIAAHPFSELGSNKAAEIVHPITETKKDIYEVMKISGLRDKGLLYIYFSGHVGYTANCVAANENGVLWVEWSQASQTALLQNRTMISNCKGKPFAAIVPHNIELPDLPVQKNVALAGIGQALIYQFNFVGDFLPKMISNLRTTNLVIPACKELSQREKALVDLGMAIEIYKGLHPMGVKYTPLISKAGIH